MTVEPTRGDWAIRLALLKSRSVKESMFLFYPAQAFLKKTKTGQPSFR